MIPALSNNRIIVAPLHWGLGHATRCIPIIRRLLDQGNHIAIASDGEALSLLRAEFPKLDHLELPSYNINYKYSSMILNMAMQSPHILLTIDEEREAITKFAEEWSANTIISDNRLGCHTTDTKNIYITHQLHIPHNNFVLAGIATRLHKKYIHDFDECWIPDGEDRALTGKMTKGSLKIPKRFIGVLSRLERLSRVKMYDYTAVLSGPEPQRTKLEDAIIKAFNDRPDLKLCLVRGTNIKKSAMIPNHNIKTYDLLQSVELNDILCSTETVICRSGYTSIMDLVHIQKKAILIPTPGQYEQEYLADLLAKGDQFRIVKQEELRADMLQ